MVVDRNDNKISNQASALSAATDFEERFRKIQRIIAESSVKVTQVVDEIIELKKGADDIKNEVSEIVSGLKTDVDCNKRYDSRWKFDPTQADVDRIKQALDDLDFGGLDGIQIHCNTMYTSSCNQGCSTMFTTCTSCNPGYCSTMFADCTSCNPGYCSTMFADCTSCNSDYISGCRQTFLDNVENCRNEQVCTSCDNGNSYLQCLRCEQCYTTEYVAACTGCQGDYTVTPCTQTSCNSCHGGGYSVTCTSCNSTSNDCTRCQLVNYSEADGCTSGNSYTPQDGCTRNNRGCSAVFIRLGGHCRRNYSSGDDSKTCLSSYNYQGITCISDFASSPGGQSCQTGFVAGSIGCSQNFSQSGNNRTCKSDYVSTSGSHCSSNYGQSSGGVSCSGFYAGGDNSCLRSYKHNTDGTFGKSCESLYRNSGANCRENYTHTGTGVACTEGYKDASIGTCQSGFSATSDSNSCHNNYTGPDGTQCDYQYGTLCTTCNAGGNVACPECHGTRQTTCVSCVATQSSCSTCNEGLEGQGGPEYCESGCQQCDSGCNSGVSCTVSYDGRNCSGGYTTSDGSGCVVEYRPGCRNGDAQGPATCSGGYETGNKTCTTLYLPGSNGCIEDYTDGTVTCRSAYMEVNGKPICANGDAACGACLTCNTGCQVSCNTGCQVSCNTGCQTQCNTGCQTSGQSCTTTCQTTCQSGNCNACQSNCQSGQCNSCQTSCQVCDGYVPFCGTYFSGCSPHY